MAYQAKWGNKGFLIEPSKIVPLMGLSTGFSKKESDGEDTSGQPTLNTRGIELQEITLETTYLAGLGVDPRGQIEEWKQQFGLRYPLYINGKLFGPKLLELQSVDFSNIILDNAGNFLQVDATIHLKEYVPPTTTVSEKKATSGSSGSGSSTGTNAGAMSATPSTTDKQNKKVVSRGASDYYTSLLRDGGTGGGRR